MARLTEYQRKYLLRLNLNAIDASEVTRWGKNAYAVMMSLWNAGLASTSGFNGDDEPDPRFAEPDEFFWCITDAGKRAVGKA